MSRHHDTLGVAPTASAEEIKAAYKRLAMELHPDRTGGDKAAEERMKAVNAAYTALKQGEQQKYQQTSQSDINDIFDMMRGAAGGFGNFHNSSTRYDVTVPLNLLLEGGEIVVNMPERAQRGLWQFMQMKPVTVSIPPNHPIDCPLRVGTDIFIVLHPEQSDGYEIIGADIHESISIDVLDALCGGHLEHRLVSGKTVELTIPAGTSYDSQLGLKEMGLNTSQGRGSYILHPDLIVPKLSPEQMKIFISARNRAFPKK